MSAVLLRELREAWLQTLLWAVAIVTILTLDAPFYGPVGFFVLAAAAIIWGTQAIGGHERSGRLDLDLARGIDRFGYALAQAGALLIRIVVLALVAALAVMLNGAPLFGRAIVAGGLLAALALLCGMCALAAGAAFGGGIAPAGVGAGVALAAYAAGFTAGHDPAAVAGPLGSFLWPFAGTPVPATATLAQQWPLWVAVVVIALVAGLVLRVRDLRS